MKKSLLLTTALCATLAASAADYTPQNWDFAKMPEGSAAGIFYEDLLSTQWGFANTEFSRVADAFGGIGISNAVGGDIVGPGANNYAGVTEDDRATFMDFINSARIVPVKLTSTLYDINGTENVLCMVGKNVASNNYGGVAHTKSFPNATLFWLTGNDQRDPVMPLNQYYRLTYDFRVITTAAQNMKWEIAYGGSYDGIDANGKGAIFNSTNDYRAYEFAADPAYNDYWNRITIDIWVEDNVAVDYEELPILVKMMYGALADNAVVLFRSVKLETVEEADLIKEPGKFYDDFDLADSPMSSVERIDIDNDVIVTAANGNITVIDANAPVEVYNMAGAKVASVAAPATVETISLDMNGVFVVKVGDKVQKSAMR